jgi:hypothetical protein
LEEKGAIVSEKKTERNHSNATHRHQPELGKTNPKTFWEKTSGLQVI